MLLRHRIETGTLPVWSYMTRVMSRQSAPRLQHYLPAVYLKQFSPDGADATRRSSLWRLGAKTHAFVKVEDQCREPFHYSKQDAQRAENLFQESEELYGLALQRIWRGQEATKRQYFGLIITMMSLHLRNPAYRNMSGLDNLELYLGLEETFMAQVLMAGLPSAESKQERLNHFSAIWRVTIMKTPDEIFTSDNPALCCAIDEARDVEFILLPITPRLCAVAFDSRRLDIVGPMTTDDLSRIQSWLVGFCLEALFSHREFSQEERDMVRSFRNQTDRPTGSVDRAYWSPNFIRLKQPLSFFRHLPALRAG